MKRGVKRPRRQRGRPSGWGPRPSATSATAWTRAPAIGEAGLGGDAVPRAGRLTRGGDRRRAGRRRAASASTPPAVGQSAWATCRRRTPRTPSARTCSGASSRRPRAAGKGTSVHVAEDADEIALLRDGSGRWARGAANDGCRSRFARAGQDARSHTSPSWAPSTGRCRPCWFTWSTPWTRTAASRARRARPSCCARGRTCTSGGASPTVDRLLEDGVHLAIGTDSLASTPDLSLWGEMATLAAHFPSVPPARWLDAATRQGARALGHVRAGRH